MDQQFFKVSPDDLNAYAVHTPFILEQESQAWFFFAVSENGNARERDYNIWVKAPGWSEPKKILDFEDSLCGPWIVPMDGYFRMFVSVLWSNKPGYSIITFTSKNLLDWDYEGVAVAGSKYYRSVTSPCVIRDPTNSGWIMFHTGQPDDRLLGRPLASPNFETFYATSDDGLNFTTQGLVGIARDEDSADGQYKPNVFQIAPEQWLMFLSGLPYDGGFRTVIYSSSDLVSWEKRGIILPQNEAMLYKPILYHDHLILVSRLFDGRSFIRSMDFDSSKYL